MSQLLWLLALRWLKLNDLGFSNEVKLRMSHSWFYFASWTARAVWRGSLKNNKKAVAILPSTEIYPQRLFCRELFVIGQS